MGAIRRSTRGTGPLFGDLAEEWAATRASVASRTQQAKGHSDRARRGDLGRWARLLREVRGDTVDWASDLSLREDGNCVTVTELSLERLQSALAAARDRWSDPTVARMLSTLRTFTGWAARRGYLDVDPCTDDDLRLSVTTERRPRALSDPELDAIRAVAATPNTSNTRRFWPARDLAILELLDGTGIRASELRALRARDIDWTTERPLLRIEAGKGSKNREVPLPSRTVTALTTWMVELATHLSTTPDLLGNRALFIQSHGKQATTGWLDQLLRTLAKRSGVELPEGAVAHAFRHSYGLRGAVRGVPTNLLSQLLGHQDPKTTAIYTHAASRNLIAALDDAGML